MWTMEKSLEGKGGSAARGDQKRSLPGAARGGQAGTGREGFKSTH